MDDDTTGYSRNAVLVAKILGGALLVLAGLGFGAVLLIVLLLSSGNDDISLPAAALGSTPFLAVSLWAAVAGSITLRVARKAVWARTVWLTGFGLFALGIAPFVAVLVIVVVINR